MAASNVAWVVVLLLAISGAECRRVADCLQSDFYKDSCPAAQSTVANVVAQAIQKDARVGSGLLRLFFHDCFVEGCDASVLITSASGDAEKDSPPNLSLHGFDVIDDAKAAVEDICPQTVSCADILAYAAAASVALLGGPYVDIQGGRLDGLSSQSSEALTNLPAPNDTLSRIQSLFSSRGLNDQDLVILSGAHTIGKAHCVAFSGRLYPTVDPTLNSEYAGALQQTCPVQFSSDTLVDTDFQTPTSFDNKYYQNVQNGKGLFLSDAELYTSPSTSGYVDQYAANNYDFEQDFGSSLIKMGQIGVKTGSNGNIRTKCYSIN